MFDKVIEIDQRPIGRTPRSNPATYTDLFTHIRELYSLTPEAKVRGYKPGRFSFNVRGGRCETCKGDGQIKIEMHFLPDVYVACETCKGARYNRETLEVRFKGRSIADVLDMSVEEALQFFAKIPKIRRRLQTLHDVGLDYIKLGQPATTLSGGEAQRVKLASELSKVATGRTLYILDEPTTGLHFADIEKLLETLQRLVDAGNTMLVIEHNLDVIKQADWIVDLGPEGGEAGGEIVAAGTPEQVAEIQGSFTGHVPPPRAAGDGRRRRGVATPCSRARSSRRGRRRSLLVSAARPFRSSTATRLPSPETKTLDENAAPPPLCPYAVPAQPLGSTAGAQPVEARRGRGRDGLQRRELCRLQQLSLHQRDEEARLVACARDDPALGADAAGAPRRRGDRTSRASTL